MSAHPIDLDVNVNFPDETCTHLEIEKVSFPVYGDSLHFSARYGSFATVFQPAEGRDKLIYFEIKDVDGGTDWTDFVALSPGAGLGACDAFVRALKQWLLDSGRIAGTIV